MTVELDDDTGETLAAILTSNESADSKDSGIYWSEGSIKEIKEIRQEVEEQIAR